MNRAVYSGIVFAAIFSQLFFSFSAGAQDEPAKEAPPITNVPSLQADALYYDAVRARIKGDEKQAEKMLEDVIKMNPSAAGAYYDLARLNMPKSPEKATGYIKKALELQQDNIWYKQQYAQILAFKNEFKEAADIYNSIAGTERYNEDYLLKSSLLYQRSGDNKKALEIIDKLIERTSDNEDYMLQKYQVYLKMNDVDGAVKVVQDLISKNPKEARYYAMLAEVYDNNKQPQKAADAYRLAEQKFGDDPAVLISIAEHYKRNNDSVNYNAYLRKTLQSKGLDAETQLMLLVNYMQNVSAEKDKKEGLDIAAKIAAEHNDNAEVLAVYGDLLSLNDNRDAAASQYKKSLLIDPSRFQVWQNLLYSYTDKKDADSLIMYSEKAMRLFPNQALVHYLNGVAYFNKRNYDKATKAINRAIDLQPDENTQQLADMYSMLGDVYNITSEYTRSDSSYEKALRLSPDNASILNNYSYYLSLRGSRLDQAEKMSKRSLELRPEEATFLDTYGWILFKQGKYDMAKTYIEKAINQGKNNIDGTVYEHLGDVFYKLNDTEKAVEYWKLAKQKGTDNEPLIDKKIQGRKL